MIDPDPDPDPDLDPDLDPDPDPDLDPKLTRNPDMEQHPEPEQIKAGIYILMLTNHFHFCRVLYSLRKYSNAPSCF